jgi:hypothetical protein
MIPTTSISKELVGIVRLFASAKFRVIMIGFFLFFLINSSLHLVAVDRIIYSRYYAQGSELIEFTRPINVSNNPKDSVYAQIASEGESVYVVWEENDPTPLEQEQGQEQNNASFFKNNNDYNIRNYDILLKKSIDGGVSFGKEINLSNNLGFSEHPQIAVSGEFVHVVWLDNSDSTGKDILYRKSTDGGKTFSEIINLSNVTNSVSSKGAATDYLEIAAEGKNVYAVWQETIPQIADAGDAGDMSSNETPDTNFMKSNSSIILRASSDSGNNFREPLVLSNDAFKSYPKIAASENGGVYLVWNVGIIREYDTTNINGEANNNNNNSNTGIFFSRSMDNGNSFAEPIKLSTVGESIGESQIAARGNNVYVVWGGNPDEKVVGDLFFTRSIDNGKTFSSPIPLEEGNALNVEVAADRYNNVYVAWQASLPDGNEEILIKRSSLEGVNFPNEFKNISVNDGISECTSISVSDDGTVYLAWEDDTFGNHEILFTKTI